MVAVVTGSTDIVQALVNVKADVEAGDYTGSTPLAEAERRGNRRAVEILRKAGATN
jgi:ankyrin repeat protein